MLILILKKTLKHLNSNLNLARDCKITLVENGDSKEYIVNFNELEKGEFLGRGQFGTVTKMFHKPSNMTFAVKVFNFIFKIICNWKYLLKMINDDLMEASDSQNEAMDLKAPLKMGDKCPSLIRFFGAIHAEVHLLFLILI